ncbi:MAG: carboxypeptidase-like regulatory domain-containing protein, partial [Bacteroidales bacterium]|nr:carboxypeptidase-like regulatory domain-containing protein [Bacteroidales bacterium]
MKSSTSMMFRPNKLAMSLAIFAVSSVAAFAQTKTVSGTIVDDFGEPIAGANVVIVGTTTGVTTDADGNFTIKDVPTNAKLRVSFLGYAEQV